jgi:hypothetical protein
MVLEIDSTGHSYQTHHAEHARRHSLHAGAHHSAGKMWPDVLLPELTHFAVAAGTAGLLLCPLRKLLQQALAC